MTIATPTSAPTKTTSTKGPNEKLTASLRESTPSLMRHANLTLSKASRGKKLLVFTMGTRGDIQPFAALCSGLQAAGFVIRILTNVNHVPFFEDFGLQAVGVNVDAEKWIKEDPTMLKMMAEGSMLGFAGQLAEMHKRSFPDVFEAELRETMDFGPDAIISSGMEGTQTQAIGASLQIPVIQAHLQVVIRSAQDPSYLEEPVWLPGFVHNLAARLICYLWLKGEQDGKHPVMIKMLPECEQDLPKNIEQQILNFEHPIEPHICGVSPLLVPERADWPYNPGFTGFWVVPQEEQERRMAAGSKYWGGGANEELRAFLAAGPEPAYIGWGSMLSVSQEHMASLAVRSFKQAGLRGIVLGGWAELTEDMLKGQPDSEELLQYAKEYVLFVRSAPHEWLFPQCCAIVHHGGAGTTAASLRSGRPVIVTPCGFDQFRNARMVEQSGAGLGLPRLYAVKADVLGAALKKVTTSEAIKSRAETLGKQLRQEDGVGTAIKSLDRFFAEEHTTGIWKARNAKKKAEFRARASPGCFKKIGLLHAYFCGGKSAKPLF